MKTPGLLGFINLSVSLGGLFGSLVLFLNLQKQSNRPSTLQILYKTISVAGILSSALYILPVFSSHFEEGPFSDPAVCGFFAYSWNYLASFQTFLVLLVLLVSVARIRLEKTARFVAFAQEKVSSGISLTSDNASRFIAITGFMLVLLYALLTAAGHLSPTPKGMMVWEQLLAPTLVLDDLSFAGSLVFSTLTTFGPLIGISACLLAVSISVCQRQRKIVDSSFGDTSSSVTDLKVSVYLGITSLILTTPYAIYLIENILDVRHKVCGIHGVHFENAALFVAPAVRSAISGVVIWYKSNVTDYRSSSLAIV